jgi:DinB superfamily
MTAQAQMANGFQWAHTVLNMAMEGCTPEVLHHKVPGSTINPIAAIYVHAVYAEDSLVNRRVRGGTSIWERDGWQQKTGVEIGRSSSDPAWAEQMHLDLGRFKPYADAVFAETDAYISSLTDEEMNREIETSFLGKQTVGQFLNGLTLHHMGLHTGEIATMKGVQGLKGLLF